jgi:hypothetical protein
LDRPAVFWWSCRITESGQRVNINLDLWTKFQYYSGEHILAHILHSRREFLILKHLKVERSGAELQQKREKKKTIKETNHI